MATNINTILNWFKTDLIPTQEQFWATLLSFRHKDDPIPQSAISNLTTVLAAKAENDQFNAHKTATDAHQAQFDFKEDLANKGAVNGYAPLNEFIKVASQYLTIVDNLTTGGSDQILSAEQGKILQEQIDGINLILTSDDVDLDTVQELVDAIKNVQMSLETILVNDLTTGSVTKALTAEMGKSLKTLIDALGTNKVDKVAGERLISVAEQTKLAGLSNVVTIVKTITSANLTTQDVAGFVTYINTLAVVLVVAANETVEYQLSDTGKVFKLLLRGRSFGTGQAAITASDVEDVTLWMQKDVTLSNYPSTRNDGALPSNKVLSINASGKVGLYTMALLPAPYMEVLIPGSTLPSTTTNFTIKGSFFTQSMTVSIAGQTINYITFVSDNLIKVNVTTSSVEGFYAVTLNNGLSATFNNALLIVYGTTFTPITTDFINVSQPIDLSVSGEINVSQYNVVGSAQLDPSKIKLNPSKNFHFNFSMKQSPYGFVGVDAIQQFQSFYRISDNVEVFRFSFYQLTSNLGYTAIVLDYGPGLTINRSIDTGPLSAGATIDFSFRQINGVTTFYRNNTLFLTLSYFETQEMYVKFFVRRQDIKKVKYVELL